MADERNQLMEELKKLNERLLAQEERLKEIERRLSPEVKKEVTPVIKAAQPVIKEKLTLPMREKRAPESEISWESRIGTYFLQIVGVAVFVFGIFFFVKFAIARGLLSPAKRVLLGLGIGTAFIAFSEYARERFAAWSLASLAGGFVIYLISIYAAYALYHLISYPLALLGFLAVSGTSMYMAAHYNSRIIAFIGLIGGYIPFWLTRWDVDFVYSDFFSILLLLIVAGTALYGALTKRWPSVAYCALAGGALVTYVFFAIKLKIVSFIGLFLLFNIMPLWFTRNKNAEQTLFENTLIPISGLVTSFGLYIEFVNYLSYWIFRSPYTTKEISRFFDVTFINYVNYFWGEFSSLGVFSHLCIAFGIFYLLELLLLQLLEKKWSSQKTVITTLFMAFLSGVVVVQLAHVGIMDHAGMLFYVHAIAFLFLAWGTMYKSSFLRWASVALFTIVGLNTHFPSDFAQKLSSVLASTIYSALIVLVGGFVAINYLYKRRNDELFEGSSYHVSELLLAGAALAPAYGIVYLFVSQLITPYESVLAAAYGAVMVCLGYLRNKILIAYVGLASLALSLWYTIFYYLPLDLSKNAVFSKALGTQPLGIVTYTLMLGGLTVIFLLCAFALRFMKNRVKHVTFSVVEQSIQAAVFFLLFIWIRLYIIFFVHYYRLFMESKAGVTSLVSHFLKGTPTAQEPVDYWDFESYKNYALTVYDGIVGLLLVIGGLAYQKPYIRYAGLFLFLIMLFRLLFIILGFSETLPRVLTLLVVGCFLIIASYLYQRLAKKSGS